MVNLAVVGLRPARKGEAISMYFVACVKRVSFGTDFMANLTLVCLGLTMERNQPAVCLLWEGSEFMVDSTVVVLGLAREESPSACVWFVACVKGPSLGRDSLVSSMSVDPGLAVERIHQHVFWSFGRGVNSQSTQQRWVYFRTD